MNKNDTVVRCFMDGTDWEWELGSADDGNKVYPSEKSLIEYAGHDVTECGIAEVEIRFVRWVVPPKPLDECKWYDLNGKEVHDK